MCQINVISFSDKPWAITSTIFQFLGKPRAYTGQTYFRSYLMPQKCKAPIFSFWTNIVIVGPKIT